MEMTLSNAQSRLIRWNQLHAIAMLAGTSLALAFAAPWILVPVAGVSFATMIGHCRGLWTTGGHFGAANAVTALRLLGVLALPLIADLGPLAVAAWALVAFSLDGVDGWL